MEKVIVLCYFCKQILNIKLRKNFLNDCINIIYFIFVKTTIIINCIVNPQNKKIIL